MWFANYRPTASCVKALGTEFIKSAQQIPLD